MQDYVYKSEIFSYAGYPELVGKSLSEIAESVGLEGFAADIIFKDNPIACYGAFFLTKT